MKLHIFGRGGQAVVQPVAKFRLHKDALFYYVFDLLVLAGKSVKDETLESRRALLEEQILPTRDEKIRFAPELTADLKTLVRSVKAQGLEGLVAERRNSRYEPSERSGASQKTRVN